MQTLVRIQGVGQRVGYLLFDIAMTGFILVTYTAAEAMGVDFLE